MFVVLFVAVKRLLKLCETDLFRAELFCDVDEINSCVNSFLRLCDVNNNNNNNNNKVKNDVCNFLKLNNRFNGVKKLKGGKNDL